MCCWEQACASDVRQPVVYASQCWHVPHDPAGLAGEQDLWLSWITVLLSRTKQHVWGSMISVTPTNGNEVREHLQICCARAITHSKAQHILGILVQRLKAQAAWLILTCVNLR